MAKKSGLHRLMQSTFHYYYLKQSYLFLFLLVHQSNSLAFNY